MTARPARSAFSTGVVAALLAAVVMLLLGLVAGAPVPPQLVADRLTTLIPLDVFAKILGSLESAAKPLVFGGVVVGQALLGGVVAALAERGLRRGARPLSLFALLLAGTWLVLALLVGPIGGIGLAGAASSAGFGLTALGFLVDALVFAGVVTLGLTPDAGAGEPAFDPSRRRWLRLATFGVPAALAAAYLARFGVGLAEKSAAVPSGGSSGTMPPALTPTSDFYIVSKNFVDPQVSLNGWQLKVSGLVDRPQTFSYEELRAWPAVTRITTLECISNEVGGDYISTGQWTGFPLRDLLIELGARPDTVKVVLRAADDYADSFPLSVAMHPDTMLVYDLNGAPLPDEHGFPLRAIVPGIYGMKNVKWLKSIELANTNFQGYWQNRGWSDVATVQTMSRIDVPRDNQQVLVGQATLIGGVAFSGDRGISKVEVSTDGGQTWNQATLEPPLSPLTWVLWTYRWTPSRGGSYGVRVRAWDGQNVPQVAAEQPTLPNGATGLDSITLRATSA